MNQKGFTPILIILILAAAFLGGYFIYQNYRPKPIVPPSDQIACTQDAKQCPNGTYVSRSGPKCDFAPCSIPSESTSSVVTTNCNKDTECSPGYICDFSKSCFVTPSGTRCSESGTKTCLKLCNGDTDCSPGETCSNYGKSTGGDALMALNVCK